MSAANGKSVADKVFLVTGANTGIGRATVVDLARRGAAVVLACRSEERTRPVLDELREIAADPERIRFVALDLASFASVRRAADAFRELDLPLDVLINNAGLAGHKGTTEDGFELTFGVNHLGHFLLTALLADKLIAAAPARVVTVASKAHYRAKGIDYEAVRTRTSSMTGLSEYGVSKLANVLFSAELGRRLGDRGVSTYSLHPGVIASDIWRRLPGPLRGLARAFMKSNEEGAQTTLHCACSDAAASETGLYYSDAAVKRPSRLAGDLDLAAELWTRSAEWVGADLPE